MANPPTLKSPASLVAEICEIVVQHEKILRGPDVRPPVAIPQDPAYPNVHDFKTFPPNNSESDRRRWALVKVLERLRDMD
jgi:hypothetical protein